MMYGCGVRSEKKVRDHTLLIVLLMRWITLSPTYGKVIIWKTTIVLYVTSILYYSESLYVHHASQLRHIFDTGVYLYWLAVFFF